MIKEFLSITEGILAGILIFKVFIPTFLQLSKTEVGSYAYFGLICFILIVIALEYQSYRENQLTWLASHLLGKFIE